MKILKRNYGHRNQILFLVLSLVYLQAIYSLSIGATFYSLVSLKSFFKAHYLILAISALSVYTIVRFKKYSQIIHLVCLIAIVGKSFILLSHSFNKLVLVLNFIYLVFAFYFYICWELEVELASFNPSFSKYDLVKKPRFTIDAKIIMDDSSLSEIRAVVTNIDDESCFLLIDEKTHTDALLGSSFKLQALYDGVLFSTNAQLVSSYDQGLGFLFEKNEESKKSWSELYKVCLERGVFS